MGKPNELPSRFLRTFSSQNAGTALFATTALTRMTIDKPNRVLMHRLPN
jgi:hypothetical protein